MGNKKTEIESIKLAQVYRLEVREDKFKNFIRWGKKNDYNSYLVGLADNQAEHGAILNTKAKYLSGLGLESENVDLMKFCEVANPKESWFELKKKLDYDQEMYGAIAIKIVPNFIFNLICFPLLVVVIFPPDSNTFVLPVRVVFASLTKGVPM